MGVAVVGLRYFCHIYGKYDKNKENVEKIQLGFFFFFCIYTEYVSIFKNISKVS